MQLGKTIELFMGRGILRLGRRFGCIPQIGRDAWGQLEYLAIPIN